MEYYATQTLSEKRLLIFWMKKFWENPFRVVGMILFLALLILANILTFKWSWE